ncbi:MAG TPA: ribosome silencing factor [Virgibacillus sp.]|nr:ribosome silencing factor [Virgibacillus sp.]
MEEKELIQIIAKACDDKLAKNIVALDMKEVSFMADYFLICHGNNERQVQAIAKAIKDGVSAYDFEIQRMEGYEQGRWVLVDFGGIVCHVFHEEERQYYNLERLWGDAPEIKLMVD